MINGKGSAGAGTGWAVSSPHVLASRAAAEILNLGGTAVDGALAAAAVLTVVYPNQCAIGGDLVALVGTPDGTAHVINGSGRSPAVIDVPALRSRHRHLPVDGALTVTVPGVVDGWHELAKRFGNRPLSAALAVAADLARDGVPVSAGLARDLARDATRILADIGLASVLTADGQVLTAGQTLRQPQLADTLDHIAADPRAFYSGPVATSIVSTLREHGSAMTIDDFAAHRSAVETPLSTSFGTEQYLSSGANTQGAFFLAGLRVVESLAAQLGRTPDPSGPDAVLLAHMFARLAAERDAHLGDSVDDWWPGSGDLADRLARGILAGAELMPGAPAPKASGDTVAIVAVDDRGQWVSLIQSVFHAFGAGLLDPGTGVLLHNRGTAFGLRPDRADTLAGGRRPPHTLMPVLVRDAAGRFVGAHGTMGGRAQPQIHTHLALHLRAGRSASESVEAPRWIVGQMEAGATSSAVVQVEADVPEPAQKALAMIGLPVERLAARDDGAGHAQVVRSAAEDFRCGPDQSTIGNRALAGRLSAASDPRADGAALVQS